MREDDIPKLAISVLLIIALGGYVLLPYTEYHAIAVDETIISEELFTVIHI